MGHGSGRVAGNPTRQVQERVSNVFSFAQVVEASLTLIMAYLIIANADKFAVAVNAAGTQYTNAVKALQGR